MRTLRFLAPAETELRRIAYWISEQGGDPRATARVVVNIRDHCRHLASLPFEIGVAADEASGLGLRRVVHGNFTLYIRYPGPETLEIYTVLCGGRDRARYFGRLAPGPER